MKKKKITTTISSTWVWNFDDYTENNTLGEDDDYVIMGMYQCNDEIELEVVPLS